jgi:hypothetical protein
MPVSHPEFEDIAEQKKGADLALLFLEKRQQPSVIGVFGIDQVGICDEDISHGEQL